MASQRHRDNQCQLNGQVGDPGLGEVEADRTR